MSNNLNLNPPAYQLPASAGNPQIASYKTGQMNAINQNSLVNSVGGRRKKIYGGENNNSISVPILSSPVKPLVSDTSAQSGAIKLTDLNAKVIANSSYDNKVAPVNVGGTKKRRKNKKYKGGYLTKWNWGCMSGGYNKTKKRKKHKKSLKSKKSKKTKKSKKPKKHTK